MVTGPSARASLLSGLLRVSLIVAIAAGGFAVLHASDWPEWRGPNRDGASTETNLPTRWSPSGENVAWSLNFGGRSTPVIFGNRLYLQTITPGDISLTQERLVAVDVDSGRVLWERKFSLYLSDVPQHRAGWASPAVDPATGNIYMFTVCAQLIALAPDGKVVWERSLPEEYGAITTHGGRTTSPIIDGDKVILNTLLQGWGDLGRPGNRYFAFDKRTGQTIWVASPQSKHYDTNYSTPIIADVKGTRQMIVGGTDGVFYALQANTGKTVWSMEISKRAILNSALFKDNTVYISHGEENIDTTEMGMVAAIDATGAGVLAGGAVKWMTRGFLPTFASPVMDADRIYSVDNSAILGAFDLKTGRELWTRSLGTIQKGSPVLADGKLYVGTENGKFYILRPSATGVEILDQDVIGPANDAEPIVASPAVSDGRIYVTTLGSPGNPSNAGHVYAIGTRRRAGSTGSTGSTGSAGSAGSAGSTGTVAQIQVFPYESLLDAGQKQSFTLKLFDASGNFIRSEPATAAQWALDQLQGAVGPDGTYTAPASGTAGLVKATIGSVTGQARVRVIPPLPWTFDFTNDKAAMPWWTANLKTTVGQVDGNPALVRSRDDTVGRRATVLMGRPEWSDLTIEADVRGIELRRQRGDVGVVNQRYKLVLFGNDMAVELHPWQAADEMTVRVPFEWAPNTWYHMKFRVENRPDGSTLAQGKVWKTGDAEPAAWTIQKIDKIGHKHGAPGLYGDGISDVQFDNVQVYKNR
jgi:outer membrane protein assembly factor BamB